MVSKMAELKLLCVGEVMAEISGRELPFSIGFAGDTFNTAVYLKRLMGPLGHIRYLTRLGTDPLSAACRRFANQHGVDMTGCVSDSASHIGVYAIATDTSGERGFSYWRNNSAARNLFTHRDELTALDAADLIYLSGISLAILTAAQHELLLFKLQELRTRGTKIAFDSNYRPALWEGVVEARRTTEAMWRICDIALPSLDDEIALFGDPNFEAVLSRLSDLGCMLGALKRGANGPIALDGTRLPSEQEAVNAVDTTAAGDSFNAGFLAEICRGNTVVAAMQTGHLLAAEVVARPGAIVATKTKAK